MNKKIKPPKNTDTFGRNITTDALIEQRDYTLQKRFTEMYEKKRIRPDDCIRTLALEFFIMPEYICRKLKIPVQKNLGNDLTPNYLRERRDRLLKVRFNELHELDRLRIDYCLTVLAWEFTLMPETIRKKLFAK